MMRDNLFNRFRDKIIYNPDIDRKLVSFQANKQAPFYSWFKYKEGFSAQLVQYLLQKLMPQTGVLLDPFAGAGSALFAARELGWTTQGIEVLPVGIYAMKARMAAECLDVSAFKITVEQIIRENFAEYYDAEYALQHISITKGAFPDDEEKQLVGYISYCHRYINDCDIQMVLLYAAFCILEDISYTRKDGQYLRWDARSNRSQGQKSFNKGTILSFRDAITRKLRQMVDDFTEPPKQCSLFTEAKIEKPLEKPLEIFSGSCLDILPTLPGSSIDFVLTSPPYANRYDYTRTYALELVYLGCSSEDVKKLRQTMLSCTVENRDKKALLEQYYVNLGRLADFTKIESVFNNQAALQEVISILDNYRQMGKLNNSHIARLVQNYFYEMCFVIYELARLLKPGGIVAMVNDNVRYAGEEVPVDIILSDIAEQFGLTTRYIWTLGRGKGNSSQQMGNHGRSELRKCVYVWERE
ncbi:site-specific DNA-methyltransferase [[Phormidium] sp. ETS-05]|uniref:site-specific DNA-methyltransferase n=1 Tax=[Phormidium] sp. ETS-05 TaxID=222819 RepID=UPI0018EF338E|nr:site-specific DNA-methyltransferase [[Phormidium] sp. ETS-05]